VLIGTGFAYYQTQLTLHAFRDQLISQQVSKGFYSIYAVFGKKKSAAILAACRSNLLEQNFLGTNPNFALHEIGSPRL